MNPPDYIITCSCRRQTTIHWERDRYVSEDPSWLAVYPFGWTCGRLGHTQRTPPQYVTEKPSLKLKVKL